MLFFRERELMGHDLQTNLVGRQARSSLTRPRWKGLGEIVVVYQRRSLLTGARVLMVTVRARDGRLHEARAKDIVVEPASP